MVYKVDTAPHIYSVYSLDGSANKNFDDFRADEDNSHLRLLFCIDALNEGIHVENVSGVILLRPTVSPIIYKQQIGRALSASKTTVPVIFDVVNNIENLYSFDSIKEEMQVAIQYFREYDRDYDIVNENFDVTDEVQECVELFNKLEETLTASWDIMFLEAKRYFEENGTLIMPNTYINENGYRLGQWIATQRANYKKKQFLSDARIRRLEAIGMVWNTDERYWENGISHANDYYTKHGNLRIPQKYVCEDGYNLGTWMASVRKKYKSGGLDLEKIMQLENMGVIWGPNQKSWSEGYSHAKAYFETHGDLNINSIYVCDDGFKLGQWRRSQLRQLSGGNVKPDRVKMLKQVGLEI